MKKPKQIKTLDALVAACEKRKSVFMKGHEYEPMPAAVLLSMQARIVYHRIKTGLFVYNPRKTKTVWGQRLPQNIDHLFTK